MRRRVVSVWLLCDSIIALRRASSCRVAVWLELMNSIHHPSSSLFVASLLTSQVLQDSLSHECETLEFCAKKKSCRESWSCFLVELVKIVATKKIVADFYDATTKNRDSARKIATIHHDISQGHLAIEKFSIQNPRVKWHFCGVSQAFLVGGIQKVATVLTSSIRWRRQYVDVDSLD
jgi:hypothetical protein